ncbi:MAG: PBSX family phage terminase large subunit [Thiomargarita sp.]|nr:PBSX family phage terminase large subunit [Thiomargarita sp.]
MNKELWQFPKHDTLHAASIRDATHFLNIWVGSVRSGKTVCSLFAWLLYIKKTAPPGMYVITGATLNTVKRNILLPLSEYFPSSVFSFSIGKQEAYFGDITFQLFGGGDEKAQDKIRGGTYAGAYCDEITTYPESFFMMLVSRLSVHGARLFGTTNPETPTHWLKENIIDPFFDETIETKDKYDLKLFHFTMQDNPYLPDDYKNNLTKLYTGQRYERLILGLWVGASGLVYDMITKSHFIDTKPYYNRCNRFYISVDYGTKNPCTFGLYGKVNGIYYLFKEYYWDARKEGKSKTDEEYANDMIDFIGKDRSKLAVIYIDPSAASITVSLKNKGLPIQSAKNSVLEGIQVVSEHLRNKTYLIDKECFDTESEYYGYVWDEKNISKDAPVKKKDHACDRDRYFLYTMSQQATLIYHGFESV